MLEYTYFINLNLWSPLPFNYRVCFFENDMESDKKISLLVNPVTLISIIQKSINMYRRRSTQDILEFRMRKKNVLEVLRLLLY